MRLLLAALRAGGLRFKYQILSGCSVIHTRAAEYKHLPFGLTLVHLRERASPVHPPNLTSSCRLIFLECSNSLRVQDQREQKADVRFLVKFINNPLRFTPRSRISAGQSIAALNQGGSEHRMIFTETPYFSSFT